MRWRKVASASPVVGDRSWLRRWWLDRPVRTKGLIVVAIPLIALITVTSAGLALGHSKHAGAGASPSRANDLTHTADQRAVQCVERGGAGYPGLRCDARPYFSPALQRCAGAVSGRSGVRLRTAAAIAAGVSSPRAEL